MPIHASLRNALIAIALAVATSVTANAASDDRMQLLDDFVHYALVANTDLANASAQALLDTGVTNIELAIMLDEGRVTADRFDHAISRALTVPELEAMAAELSQRVERGRLDMARDSKRIDEAIAMLTGTQRQRLIAQRRLVEAGEFAVPGLLNQINSGRDQRLVLASVDVIRQIGPEAVIPLCIALPHLGNPTGQRIVCDLLGDLSYPHSAPFLMELMADNSTTGPVREAANRAIRRMNLQNPGGDLSQRYTHLARQYFDNASSLIAQPLEETNNVWRYDPTIGLTPTAVHTEVFGQIMAMRMTERALIANADNAEAISLFVAANLKRRNDLPQGAPDPIYGESDYSPSFFATVFGTSIALDVLGLALDIQDTQLVRDAIAALSKTTGGSNLFSFGDGRQPLLEAMRYPDRRVQYEASLTLGRALPQEGFAGDYTIVPLLASAIRAGGRTFALVIGDTDEDRQETARRLEGLGFEIVGSGSSVEGLRAAIENAVGIDLVATRMRNADRARNVVAQLRIVPKTAVVPTLVLADATDVPNLRLDYRAEPRVEVSRPGLSSGAFEAVVDQLMHRAVGGRMTEAEAEVYAIEAIATLRDIAISNSPVYDPADAEVALLDALEARRGGLRLHVADILALIDSERAQRSLFDAALTASGGEQTDLLVRVADSIKRFGNRSQNRHVDALIDLVANSSGRTAEAAAEVHGALNLPPAAAVRLIALDG